MKKHSKEKHKESSESPKTTSELFSALPLEDKLWMLWQRYSRILVLVIILVIFGFLGFQGVTWYKTWQIEKLQNEYREAVRQNSELAFAEANIKEPLAGTVFASLADKLVSEAKYDEALAHYKKALKSLQSTAIGDRVELGMAMVTFHKGDKEGGKDLLKKIVNNQKYLGAIRGEAAYQSILINLQEKDYGTAKDFLTIMAHIPNTNIWGQKAIVLQESTPELISKG